VAQEDLAAGVALSRSVIARGEQHRGDGVAPATLDRIGTAKWLVVSDSRTTRRRIAAHETVFATTFPARSWELRRWIAHPTPTRTPGCAGLSIPSLDPDAVAAIA
jgi:hypothetical protein